MRGNTIRLQLKKNRVTQTGNLFQFDYGQFLVFTGVELPGTYEVHFSNQEKGNAKTALGDSTGVEIPDEFLLTGEPIHVWVYLHDGESDGETEYHGIIGVTPRAKPTDQAPTPVQQSVIDQAISALTAGVAEVEGLAEGIPQTIDTALAEAKASGEFDGPPGADGKDGKDGSDGQPGADGKDGADGYSPTATVTKSGKKTTITITDKNGTTTEEVLDGADGQPGAVQDVKIDGTSVLAEGVANIPIASTTQHGVIKSSGSGIYVSSTGTLFIDPANSTNVKAGTSQYKPIVPSSQHESAFYGLAKAAGDTTQKDSSNAVGTYTANARKAIQNMLGVEGRMRYLKGITIAEETASVGFDTDKDGLPFACDEFEIIALIPPVDGSSRTLVYGIETTEVTPSSSKWVGQCGGITNTTNAYIVQSVIKRMQNAWMARSYKCSSSSTDFTGAINTADGMVRFSLNGASWVRSNNPMYATSLAICISNGIPAGTIFEIYAHDYQG